MPRFVVTASILLVLAVVPQASSMSGTGLVSGLPSGLHAFLLRVDEPVAHQYPRTPSFAWTPAPERGGHYQFELATSPNFEDGSIVFKDVRVPMPAETIARQLPWLTGEPYALWAHVRWMSANGRQATRWSVPFGFNLRWNDQDVPQQLPAPDGLVRWAPVEGATGYQVLYPDLRPRVAFQTTTNVADEREFFTFHASVGYSMPIHWRVRAIRDLGKSGATNGLPAVSYGPWSAVFTSTNAPQADAALTPNDTVSNKWITSSKGRAFSLTPGFAWTPSAEVVTDGLDVGSPLYRVYVFTDSHCVNRVFTGSVVGSPAFAPRTKGGPIALPNSLTTINKITAGPLWVASGSEGDAFDATGAAVTPNEEAGSFSGSGDSSTSSSSSSSSASSSTASSGSATGSSSAAPTLAKVDLWDSGWPSGRYYWTVVPVTAYAPVSTGGSSSSSSSSTDTTLAFQDVTVPQDACESGQVKSFGKVSVPTVTSAGRPFVSGVVPSGRSIAAAGVRPAVYSLPIVAWIPAVGATKYQVQMSHTLYPWFVARTLVTPATSATLPLSKFDAGTWYYRVRGVNEALPVGAQKMAWSSPVAIRVTGDHFTVVK
jgi:hypothetical protein